MPVEGIGRNEERRSRLSSLLNGGNVDTTPPEPEAPEPDVASAAPDEPSTPDVGANVDAPARAQQTAQVDEPAPAVQEQPEAHPEAALEPVGAEEEEPLEPNAAVREILDGLPRDPRLRTPVLRRVVKVQKAQLNNRIKPELNERVRRHSDRTGEPIASVVERGLDLVLSIADADAGLEVEQSPLVIGQPVLGDSANEHLEQVLASLATDPRLYAPKMRAVETDYLDQFNHRIPAQLKRRLNAHSRREGETITSVLFRAVSICMDVAEAEAKVDQDGDPIVAED